MERDKWNVTPARHVTARTETTLRSYFVCHRPADDDGTAGLWHSADTKAGYQSSKGP
jgi:hypothetical protein